MLIIGVTILAYVPWYPSPHPVAEAIRQFFVHNTPFYFRSMKVISEGEPLPGQVDSPSTTTTKATNEPPTLLSVHPHGIFTLGWSMLYLRLRQVDFCFSSALFVSPFFRLFSRVTGNPASADKANMQALMRKGRHLALIPGGFEEATLTINSPTVERVYIKNRKGFIKLCLQQGYQVRPVYSFGEVEAYDNVQGQFSLRLLMNRYGIPAVIPFDGFPFPVCPNLT